MEKIKWQLDPSHSEISFKVRHMMVSNVTGEFKKFDVQLETEGHDISSAKAKFTADIESVTTEQKDRDLHLKSADFFDLENHPQLSFESTEIYKIDEEEYEMKGDLTIRGTTKPITLKVENYGVVSDPNGKHRTGFEITGKLKRMDFGLKYNAMLEAGGAVVGNEVKLLASIELVHDPKDC